MENPNRILNVLYYCRIFIVLEKTSYSCVSRHESCVQSTFRNPHFNQLNLLLKM